MQKKNIVLIAVGVVVVLVGLWLWNKEKNPGYTTQKRAIGSVSDTDTFVIEKTIQEYGINVSAQRCGGGVYFVKPTGFTDVPGSYFSSKGTRLTHKMDHLKQTLNESARKFWYNLRSCTPNLVPLVT